MLGYINAKLDTRNAAQNRSFDTIVDQNSQIVDILAIHQGQLAAVAGQERVTQTAIVEALAILKSGEMRRLMNADERVQGDMPRNRAEFQVGPEVSTYVLSLGDGVSSLTGKHEVGHNSFDRIRQSILGWLHFPQMHYRFESVKASHKKKCWIGSSTRTRDRLMEDRRPLGSTSQNGFVLVPSATGCVAKQAPENRP